MKDINALFAGFGGQGVLFLGKVVAYCGLFDGREVSWLPSYGPEMRGGTANCSVCVSDNPICSPLVIEPDVLVSMNLPSYDKFIDRVKTGGTVILDSSLIHKIVDRKDLNVYYIPATELADKNGLKGLANIILLGKLLSVVDFTSKKTLENTINKVVPASKQYLIVKNMEAIELGMNYK